MSEYKVSVSARGNHLRTVRGIVAQNASDAIDTVHELLNIKPIQMIKDPDTGKIVLCGSAHSFLAERTA
jgi:hypothetical protein